MDGDLARLSELVPIARQHDMLVVVDDAHGFGVLGRDGVLGRVDGVFGREGVLGRADGVLGRDGVLGQECYDATPAPAGRRKEKSA